jgi:sulfur carrier protein
MIITLNGTRCDIEDGTTVAVLITEQTGSGRGTAVAVDGEVVPRSVWDRTALLEGQTVEMVTAVQGG